MSTRLTERQFFILSLSGLLLGMALLYTGLLRPRFRERARLRNEISQKTQQLMQTGYFLGEGPLLEKKAQLDRELRQRMEEWADVQVRLGTFPDQQRLGTMEVGLIDYKFALHATRLRLRTKAAAQEIAIPALLGMPDEIDSDTLARERYLQLKAVESLVDISIEYGIADIRSIDPLPPVTYQAGPLNTLYLEEYPLRVTFEGDMPRLYRLWEAMFQTGRAMMLRNIAMEKTALNEPDKVRMTATLGTLLFMGDLNEIRSQTDDPTRRVRPMGH